MPELVHLIRKVRPAPVQDLLLQIGGYHRRRIIPYRDLLLWSSPGSDLGSHLLSDEYEPGLVEALTQYLPTGGTFLDIGANEGFFSVLASRLVGETGKVVAVEPQSRLLPVIERNWQLNGCLNCQVFAGVIGANSEPQTLHLSPDTNTGSTSLHRSVKYHLPTETVASRTLEQLLQDYALHTVDLVKIDVEGAEYDILMASESVIASGRLKAIALEYHPAILKDRGLSMDDIHHLLTKHGYSINPDLDRAYRISVYARTAP